MVAWNTTSPASVMRPEENLFRNPEPAGDGSPMNATIVPVPRKTPLRPKVMSAAHAGSPEMLIDGSPSDLVGRGRRGEGSPRRDERTEDECEPPVHRCAPLRGHPCATLRLASLSRWRDGE